MVIERGRRIVTVTLLSIDDHFIQIGFLLKLPSREEAVDKLCRILHYAIHVSPWSTLIYSASVSIR